MLKKPLVLTLADLTCAENALTVSTMTYNEKVTTCFKCGYTYSTLSAVESVEYPCPKCNPYTITFPETSPAPSISRT
eukprot:g38046.t1